MSALLAIFDVDGTLVDSRHMINTAMARAFEAQGLTPPDYDATRRIVGLSLDVAIDRLAPRDIGPDKLRDLVQDYKDIFVKMRQSKAHSEPLYDGASDLLVRLKGQGWQLGVATGKSRRGLDNIIKINAWGDIFDCHFCADDGPGKPDPAMVLSNLMATGTLPERAVMIGDTSFDMIMSKRADVLAYGVDWGFHTRDEIHEGGADAIFSTMADLGAAMDRFAMRLAA